MRESLRERETLRNLAPHVVRALPFVVPIYRESSRGLIKVRIGLKLYDWLTPGRNRERYRVLRPVDALALEPAIRAEGLRGAGYYFDDLLVFPERFCLENVLSACRHGAHAFNYAEVEELIRDAGGVPVGVRVRDLLTDRVATLGAQVIVNATGPWIDRMRERVAVWERGRHTPLTIPEMMDNLHDFQDVLSIRPAGQGHFRSTPPPVSSTVKGLPATRIATRRTAGCPP